MGKSRASEACISAAKKALKTFKDADLQKYVSHVFDKMRSYENLHRTEAIQRAIKEVNDERMESYFESLQTKANDVNKANDRAIPIRQKKQDLLQTIVKRITGLGDNVESAQRSAHKRLMDKSFNLFSGEETGVILHHKNDIDIVRAIDGKEASPTAKSLAEKFHTYIEARNIETVNSNALPLHAINKDRFFRAIHDPGKLLRGGRNLIQSALNKKFSIAEAREIWKEKILPLLNMKETFFDTDALNMDGSINIEEAHKILDEIFDSITTGKPDFIREGVGKQNMFFYWKDMESWMAYNKDYGRGNFYNAWMADIQSSSNKIGLAEMFGSNPQATYDDLAKIENKVNPVGTTRKNLAKVNFKWVSGQDRAPVNPTQAAFWSALRSIGAGALLPGRVTILSFADLANGIMYAHRWGHSYFEAYGVHLSGMFNLLKTEERQFLAATFKEMTQTHLGYVSRFTESQNVGNIINNINAALYKYTLMDGLDRGNKLSAIQLQSRILGKNSAFEHAELPEQMKKMLEKFNITPEEWNGIRHRAINFKGKKLFTMDSIDNLSNDELRNIYGSENIEKPLYHLKNDLYRKVYAMFDVASENAVLTPGAFMKAVTKGGTLSGTIPGEILRSVMQFKMYPFEYIDKVLYQGLKNADGVQNKLIFGALLFGATLPMSWLSIFLDNISKGKTMPSWDKMNFGEKTQYAKDLLLPGIGIMGNFFSPDQPWLDAGAFFTTPAIKLFYDAIRFPYRIVEGTNDHNMKKIEQAFTKVGRHLLPGASMPFVSPLMREMFGDKPYLQPGQVQLYGA